VYHSPIIRLTAGAINKINDARIGLQGTPQGPSTEKFGGQLGNGIWLDDANILFDSSMGTVYGGHFRYVRLAADAPVDTETNHVLTVGQLVFWTPVATAAPNLYQVTTGEAGLLPAGIVLNSGWTPGNYGVIQDVGLCYVHFRGTITGTPAIGRTVTAALDGAGTDLGFIDQIDTATVPALDYAIGRAVDLPVNGQAKRIFLNIANVR
jgi:hypothetical protein